MCVVDLCDGRPVCVVDLVRRRTGCRLMGVQLPVLTSEPSINLLRGVEGVIVLEVGKHGRGSFVFQKLSVGLREQGGNSSLGAGSSVHESGDHLLISSQVLESVSGESGEFQEKP